MKAPRLGAPPDLSNIVTVMAQSETTDLMSCLRRAAPLRSSSRCRTHCLRGRASGIDVVPRYSAVFTLRDGKIMRFRDFASRSAALEAVGLRE